MMTRNRFRARAIPILAAVALVTASLLLPRARGAEQYTYDAAGRLTQVTYDDGTSVVYTYDENSNLLSVQVLTDDLFKDGFE